MTIQPVIDENWFERWRVVTQPSYVTCAVRFTLAGGRLYPTNSVGIKSRPPTRLMMRVLRACRHKKTAWFLLDSAAAHRTHRYAKRHPSDAKHFQLIPIAVAYVSVVNDVAAESALHLV